MHNLLRYALLIVLLAAIIRSFSAMFSNAGYGKLDNKLGLWLVLLTHVQIIIGLALYFMKGWHSHISEMAEAAVRYRALEHPLVMIIAAVLITIGRSKGKRKTTDKGKHQFAGILWLIALVLILSRIPSWTLPGMH
ncbi:MAG: hypothetical protein KDC92_01310 [Bacteroidetes bacterium]|nr:hypothetical protein [Bacteroidota bacterium]